MKSEIFSSAISNRNRVKFLYDGFNEIMIDPYFISTEKTGKKFIYGRTCSTNQIKKFEYYKITNIRILRDIRFSPIIPIISSIN